MPVLSASQIGKRFGGVTALDHASFACDAGEIHGLLGGNGAGKSTMVKILTGVLPPDSGSIELDGSPVRFASPIDAGRQGIVSVFQELSLIPDLTVAENMFLGRERRRLGLIDRGAQVAAARQILNALDFPSIEPTAIVKELTLAERQLVEIAKAISREPRVLILDEATSALGGQEVQRLFAALQELKRAGCAIVFISHRMDEVRDLCDRATIFRDGVDVGTVDIASTPPAEIIQLMIGRHLEDVFPPRPPRPPIERPRLEVSEFSWGGHQQRISFTLHAGEILGLAGLEGQGQGDLLLALFGVYAQTSGVISIDGRRIELGGPRRLMRAGSALIPEDRKTQGLILPLNVRDNVTLPVLPALSRGGVIRQVLETDAASRIVERLSIKTPSLDTTVRHLSGGNQQKVAIGKWLLSEANVYLMYDPTRGIDVATKQEIYQLLRNLADQGAAILLFSTDSAEIIGLCDRALVMFEERIVAELRGDDISRESLLAASLGMDTDVVEAIAAE